MSAVPLPRVSLAPPSIGGDGYGEHHIWAGERERCETVTQQPFSQQYPDLFVGLAAEQVYRAEQILANHRLEGWDPSVDELRDLTDLVSDRIDRAEYLQRAHARIADRHRAASLAR